jgi:hypothetical protein
MKAQIATILLAGFLATACAAPAASTPGVAAAPIHEQMQNMQKHMHQVHATKDPAERKRLMEEHMKAMQGMMPMMSGMGARTNADPAERMQMMEMRMEMMHKMMEQMLQHDAAGHEDK